MRHPISVGSLCALALALAPAAGWCGGVWTTLYPSGNPSTQITALAQGDSGTILVSTGSDVYRYDGIEFRHEFPPAGWRDSCVSVSQSPPFSPFCRLSRILQSTDGSLWLGSGNVSHLVRRRPDGTWQTFPDLDGTGLADWDHGVREVVQTIDGTIHVATHGGIYRFDGVAWHPELVPGQDLGPEVLVADPVRGGWWASYPGLVVHFTTGGALDSYPVSESFGATDILPARTGRLFISAMGAAGWDVEELKSGSFVRLTGFPVPTDNPPEFFDHNLAEGPFGDLWIARANDGVVHCQTDSIYAHIFGGDGPPSSRMRSILVDQAGVLWLGSDAGLTRYEGSAWLSLRADNRTLPYSESGEAAVFSIAGQASGGDPGPASGTIWFGESSAVFPGYWPTFQYASGRLVGSYVPMSPTAIAAGDSGDAWIGGYTSLVHAAPPRGYACWDRTLLSGCMSSPDFEAPIQRLRSDPVGGAWIAQAFGDAPIAFARDTLLRAVIRTVNGNAFVTQDLQLDRSGRVFALVRIVSPAGHYELLRFDPADSSTALFDLTSAVPDSSTRFAAFCILPGTNPGFAYLTDKGVFLQRGSSLSRYDFSPSSPRFPFATNATGYLSGSPDGKLWVSLVDGLGVTDGTDWSEYGLLDGIAGTQIEQIDSNSQGVYLACAFDGVSFFRPDTIPPRARITSGPAATVGTGTVQFNFVGGDVDSRPEGIRLATQIDGASPTPFSATTTRIVTGLLKGSHVFRVWAKDRALNVSPLPDSLVFFVDPTPPIVTLTSPHDGSAVRGVVNVIGLVDDPRPAAYELMARPEGDPTWTTLVNGTGAPTPGDAIARWDTRSLAEGAWILQLTAANALGLSATTQARVRVDNLDPPDSTSERILLGARGGEIFSLHGEVRAYFPPNEFARAESVSVDSAGGAEAAAALPGGTTWSSTAYALRWNGALHKTGTLTFLAATLAGMPAGASPRVYRLGADGEWHGVGGTLDPASASCSAPLSEPGTYRLLVAPDFQAAAGQLQLAISPRVLSRDLPQTDNRVAITFNLAVGDHVQVAIYNRAGRLTRRVLQDTYLPPGGQVVYWDGRDQDGRMVQDGLYIVALSHGGKVAQIPLAVARP